MRHGGDLDAAARVYGRPIPDWLDLSTGINPAPYPLSPPPGHAFSRLPRADEIGRLEAAARRAYRVPRTAGLVAAPGTQAIIGWLPYALPAPATLVVSAPTYGEHAATWAAAGHAVREAAHADFVRTAQEAPPPVVAVAGNPNNPDGHVRDPGRLLALARRLGTRGGLLVIDEAFADVAPEASVLPHLADEPVLALRSFGKFFGLAGLRLGFAAGAPARVEVLRARLGPWAVAGPAIHAGVPALSDEAWQAAARERLAAAAARLDGLLGEAGLEVAGGTALFRLATHPEAGAVHARLAAAGVWVRRFDDRPTWLRFGVPLDPADLARLGAALGVPPGAATANGG